MYPSFLSVFNCKCLGEFKPHTPSDPYISQSQPTNYCIKSYPYSEFLLIKKSQDNWNIDK